MSLYRNAFVSLLTSSTLAYAQTPSLNDALSSHANLSSLQGLLRDQLPDLFKTLQAHNADTDPITIVAPSNLAFSNVPYTDIIGEAWANNNLTEIGDIINYHVLAGAHTSKTLNTSFQFLPSMLQQSVTGGQKVGAVVQSGSQPEVVFTSGESTRSVVKVADISFTGGIIQMVDAFLIPPLPFVDTAEKYNLAVPAQSITSFIGALYSQSNNTLARFLNTTKDVTVFVPVNIGTEAVESALTSMSPSAFQSLLDYHVVVNDQGPYYSSNFSNGTSLQTLQGESVSLLFNSNSYFINSARIISTDYLVNDGVFHVIDNVLNPSDTTAQPNPTSATQEPVLSTQASSLNSSAAPFTTFLPGIESTVTNVANTPATNGAASATSTGLASTETSTQGSAASMNKIDFSAMGRPAILTAIWLSLVLGAMIVM